MIERGFFVTGPYRGHSVTDAVVPSGFLFACLSLPLADPLRPHEERAVSNELARRQGWAGFSPELQAATGAEPNTFATARNAAVGCTDIFKRLNARAAEQLLGVCLLPTTAQWREITLIGGPSEKDEPDVSAERIAAAIIAYAEERAASFRRLEGGAETAADFQQIADAFRAHPDEAMAFARQIVAATLLREVAEGVDAPPVLVAVARRRATR
jgi:hypothetical protein